MAMRDIINLIDSTSQLIGIDPNLAMAIAGHESGFEPAVARYESAWKYLVVPKTYAARLGISLATEIVLQSMSWGCFQVMGSVCRELGYQDHLTLLVTPQAGILYGCKKLFQLSNVYKLETDVIAAYNQGNNRKDASGNYCNQSYVDDVSQRLAQLRHVGH